MSQSATGVNRRQFLGRSACNAAGLAAGLVGLSAGSASSPAETVRIGVVGVRRQGRKLALEFAAQPNTDVAAVCDIDGSVLDRAAAELAAAGVSPRLTGEYRQLIDHPRIDAIVVATPDHSHASIAIEALTAGKDVYLESPVCHTIAEGAALADAARRFGRVVQSGLFDRSLPHVRNAIEVVRSGRIGTVPLVKAWAVHRRSPVVMNSEPFEAPPRTDYAAWLAPTAERPFDPQRFHRNWNAFWDYGSGELGTWGVPLLDLAAWGLDVELPQRVSASGSRIGGGPTETPDVLQAVYTYPNATVTWEHRQWSNHPPEGRSAGVAFHGTRGTLILDRGGWKVYDAAESMSENGRADLALHVADFLAAVRSRHEVCATVETGIRAATLCHLGNISHRLGREVRYDAATATFRDDDAANALMSAKYRPHSFLS
ncbi:MAG: Gfo/Idh/MocA family oxidoreductase [Planctomycetaceae bacterium]|nr:Gfo/Idh/MocA family oxidoreductase [Planctomycetaceae bacterium]